MSNLDSVPVWDADYTFDDVVHLMARFEERRQDPELNKKYWDMSNHYHSVMEATWQWVVDNSLREYSADGIKNFFDAAHVLHPEQLEYVKAHLGTVHSLAESALRRIAREEKNNDRS